MDHASQHLHQPLRDRQPQARSSEAARRRGVRLREGLEEMRLLFGGHADPGVRHRERQSAALHPDRQPHSSALGELQRVTEQVEEDLAHPRRIALDALGDQALVDNFEGDSLVPSPVMHQRDHLAHEPGG